MIDHKVTDEKTAMMVNNIIDEHPHTFILIRMNGCPPCMALHPKWMEMSELIKNKYSDNSDVAVIDFEKSFLSKLDNVGDISGFPTVKYINRKKNIIEPYGGERSSKALVKWVDSKISNKQMSGGSEIDDMHKLAEIISSSQLHSAKPQKHNPNKIVSLAEFMRTRAKINRNRRTSKRPNKRTNKRRNKSKRNKRNKRK